MERRLIFRHPDMPARGGDAFEQFQYPPVPATVLQEEPLKRYRSELESLSNERARLGHAIDADEKALLALDDGAVEEKVSLHIQIQEGLIRARLCRLRDDFATIEALMDICREKLQSLQVTLLLN